jgi:membrane-bound lytic murein transglycosylase D
MIVTKRLDNHKSVSGFRHHLRYTRHWLVSLALSILMGASALGFCLLRLPLEFVNASENDQLRPLATPSTVVPERVASSQLNLRMLLRQAFVDLQLDAVQIPASFIDNVVEQLHVLVVTHHQPTQVMLDRSVPYMKIINLILQQQRLPDLFAVIPFIESSFELDAIQPETGARGLWQFLPATARSYGLNVSEAIDERLDPYWSTFAASRYLKELQNIFGAQTPLLVLAAYNFGESNLSRAIIRTRTRKIWKLFQVHQIPNQTRNYLIKALAVWCVLRHADRFRFVYRPDASPAIMRRADIAFPYPSMLSEVAKRTDLDESQLRAINPHLLTGYLPAFATMRMPIDQVERFFENEVEFSLAWNEGRCCPVEKADEVCHYTVKPGENLSIIASRFPISIAAIKRMNHLNGLDPIIRPGQKLLMCQPSKTLTDAEPSL